MEQTPKEIIFEEEARDKLASGIAQLADLVAFTLGPKGRNVGLEKAWGGPNITNDGNSIVKEISLKDPFENMGVEIAKQVAEKIKENCGDGTTTATLLLNALVEGGVRYIAAGASPILVKRGIEKATEAVVEEIERRATPVKEQKQILDIATVSASGQEEIGEMVAEAFEKVGRSGVVTIEEGKATTTSCEIVEGMQFDRGYISPHFCTNIDRMTVEMHQPKILLVENKISSIHDLLPLLQAFAPTGQELLIIAEDLEADALSTLVINKLRGTLKVAAVKAPGFGDRRKAMLEDIATLTGATVVSEEQGVSLQQIDTNALGQAEKVTITRDHTTLVTPAEGNSAVQGRIKQLESEIAASKNSWDKEKLEERKAKLAGGVAVIKVGGATEPAMKQRKQVFEDSLNSTKAAIDRGIVPGGGITLFRARQAIDSLKLEGDEAVGAQIVKEACSAPLRQLITNSGYDGSVLLNEIAEKSETFGFNAITETVEDLQKAGVIDPAYAGTILQYAASAAGVVLISEALVNDAPEDEDA